MSLELKRKELELARVSMARQELEYKIDERYEDIERLKSNVEIQKQAEEKLKKELKELKGE